MICDKTCGLTQLISFNGLIMTKYIRSISIVLLMMACQILFAGSGLLFNVSATGTAGDVEITLCLNGRGALSCQNYDVSALSLNICAALKHSYPNAGIKVNTPDFKVGNLGMDCVPISNGYCLFPVSNTACRSISIVANTPLTISPTSLPPAPLNVAYSQTITASDGTPPYTYALVSGALPTGLTLNTSTGKITGTPTTAGTFSFTIGATDANANTGSRTYSVAISSSLCIDSTTTLPFDLDVDFTGTGSPACGDNGPNPDRYKLFQYNSIACIGGQLKASTCGQTTLDTQLSVFQSQVPPFGACIAGNDDSCGVQSEVTWSAGGGVYDIVINGFGGATGQGNIIVTCTC
ncbi:putative Ig domain-containing protein (plasmid) [Legionella lytica]|uniref:Ig domain-containing protein n=2 Tax=Legionella lytica TaxID=96232 RepID=A0ABY4YCD6_9GAMM|nr:putative Ig domain-containing protein [Legionella lytica]